jgi:heme-degrading monooxygenase HmoA
VHKDLRVRRRIIIVYRLLMNIRKLIVKICFQSKNLKIKNWRQNKVYKAVHKNVKKQPYFATTTIIIIKQLSKTITPN